MRRALFLLALTGCAQRTPLPEAPPTLATVGRCGAPINEAKLCRDWSATVEPCQGEAARHDSFPELSPEGCFVPVRHGALARADPIPEGCGYPPPGDAPDLQEYAAFIDWAMEGELDKAPMHIACELPDEVRRAAGEHNQRVLKHLEGRLATGERWAYATVSTFGFGWGDQAESPLLPWRPGDACIPLTKREMDRLSVNVRRAGEAARAYHGGVAPIVTVSGGAVHSPLYEAFALLHLLACTFDVPDEAVLLDPCADHTHTNIRNTGGLVIGIGGRHGYLVTDEGLQGGYLQEYTAFDLIGGAIDSRALRDWGYLIGAWRQASIGYEAGFWFTPYRFWGEPRDGLGSHACVR